MNIERILENPQWKWDFENLFCRPHIPSKKLNGAIGSYAPSVDPSDVLVLIDDTVFGGAKDGLLLTRDAIYAKRPFDLPRMVRLSDIRSIEPAKGSRLIINGSEFYKADIVGHLVFQALSTRIASLLATGEQPGGGGARDGGDLVGLYRRLGSRAMQYVHDELVDELLLTDDLLQRQAARLESFLTAFERSAKMRSRTPLTDGRAHADALEMAHVVLQVLHYYSMSQLPEDFKAGMGEQLAELYATSEVYKDGYRNAFRAELSKDFEMGEEDLRMMTLVFFHRDGTSEIDLKIPRPDAVIMLLERVGVPRADALTLRSGVEADVAAWLSTMAEVVEEEDDTPVPPKETLDPCEVLGIRPNASTTEIELAYKGRRSQYHPDRYANEDQETIRWATIQMQRVNEAYAILSDPQQRERIFRGGPASSRARSSSNAADRTRPAQEPRHTPDAAHASAPLPAITDYFSRLALPSRDQARVFLAPSIPSDKARNAMEARGWAERWYMSQPLVLIDDTLRGGGKEGLLISDKCISFKSIFAEPEEYIMLGGFNGGFEARGTKVLRMGEECKEFVHISNEGVACICQALNAYLNDVREWHRVRAKAGVAESAHFMSSSCSDDPEESMRWLRQAAEAGHRVSQHNLAMNLQYRDPAQAFEWFTQAAAQGCEASRERLEHERFDPYRREPA